MMAIVTRRSMLRWNTWLAVVTCSSAFVPHSFKRSSLFRRALGSDSTITRWSSLVEPPAASSSSSSSTSSSTVILAPHQDFIKPGPDRRQYRAIRLANNLQVLLTSFPESDVEAGAVHVQAGHMDDPTEFPGLAHFHEHMLFLGTHKYPDESEYEAFLSQYGGSSNAYTDMEDTNYYFSVTPPSDDDDDDNEVSPDREEASVALVGALDRLAQFFIAPKFDPSMVERELRAIDSEYRNSFTSDSWRNYQCLKNAANQRHPFSKFGCGNYNTLTQGGMIVNATYSEGATYPTEALVDFWKSYYQTYNLRLCVVGRASLDALQKAVEDTFGHLPKSEGNPRRGKLNPLTPATHFAMEHAQYSGEPAFGTEQLGKVREMIPLLESRVIKVHFATPPLDDPLLKESRPYRVLSHLLGHESPGSLHALLNEAGLLTGLSSGIGIDNSDFSLFSLTLSLTPEGMQQKDKVLDYIFQWIALLKQANEDGKMEDYHEELRKISDVNFRFRENGDATDFCSAAAELMFSYEPSQVLLGTSYTGKYDPIVASAFLDRLRPENALITVTDSGHKPEGEWETEKWYGAKYRDMTMTPEQRERWTSPPEIDPRLHLPALNEYIPTDFSLRCDDDNVAVTQEQVEGAKELPQLIIQRPDLRMWHKMDRTWRVPKTFIRLSLLSPNAYRSPRTMTLNRIYQRVLNDDLNSFVYDASVAGCDYRVTSVPTGYRLSVKGYSEKLPFLLDTLTLRMLTLIDEMKEGPDAHPGLALKFQKARDNLLRETKNYRLDTPYEVASYNSRLLSEEKVWYIDNYIAEMEGEQADKDPLTLQECARVVEECLLGRVKAEALCIGNINEDNAKQIAGVIDCHFLKDSRPLLDVECPLFRSMKLPTKTEAIAIFGPDVATKAIPLVYQEVANSESEENSAVELVLQTGCDLDLGYEGVATLELIGHIAYNSAYNQLRTKEQLGYIVSAFAKKTTGGGWALSVIVQSSVAEPSVLEDRCEAWLAMFRKELEDMEPESIAMEAGAVVAQLLERDTKLSQEVSHAWNEIMMTESFSDPMKDPPFDRLDLLADELVVADSDPDQSNDETATTLQGKRRKSAADLKVLMLAFFDKYLAATSPERRGMSSRVYNQASKELFESNVGKPGVLSSYAEMLSLKQFLSTWPVAPYWRVDHRDKR